MSNLPINSPIKGPGLTKPGVVILQFLVIFLFEAIEILFRNSLGIITCLALWRWLPKRKNRLYMGFFKRLLAES